jgi:hypothetical protein
VLFGFRKLTGPEPIPENSQWLTAPIPLPTDRQWSTAEKLMRKLPIKHVDGSCFGTRDHPRLNATTDVSQLCFTKEVGKISGRARFFDLVSSRDIGGISWRVSRLTWRGYSCICLGDHYALSVGNKESVTMRLFNNTTHQYRIGIGYRGIVLKAAGDLWIDSLVAQKEDETSLFCGTILTSDGNSIKIQLEPNGFTIIDALRSFLPFCGYPNPVDRFDRPCQEPLTLDLNTTLLFLSLYTYVRHCVRPNLFLSEDRSSGTGAEGGGIS